MAALAADRSVACRCCAHPSPCAPASAGPSPRSSAASTSKARGTRPAASRLAVLARSRASVPSVTARCTNASTAAAARARCSALRHGDRRERQQQRQRRMRRQWRQRRMRRRALSLCPRVVQSLRHGRHALHPVPPHLARVEADHRLVQRAVPRHARQRPRREPPHGRRVAARQRNHDGDGRQPRHLRVQGGVAAGQVVQRLCTQLQQQRGGGEDAAYRLVAPLRVALRLRQPQPVLLALGEQLSVRASRGT